MHDQEKSDFAIVAGKPPNKAGRPVAEAVEPRAGTKRNADQQSTHRTADRGSRDPGAGPRTASRSGLRRHTPEVGAGCSNWARPDLVRGCSAMSIPTANLDPERTRAGGSFAMRRMVCVQSMLYYSASFPWGKPDEAAEVYCPSR